MKRLTCFITCRQKKVVRKMDVCGALAVCLAVVFGSVTQAQEPLTDYVGRFAEFRLRAG